MSEAEGRLGMTHDACAELSSFTRPMRRNFDRSRNIRSVVTNVEAIEREVEKLTREELSAFRDWFLEHDWREWDRELRQDVADGKLDRFASEVLAEHGRGETKEI